MLCETNLSAAFNTARLTMGCASGTSRGHWSRTHRCGPSRSARAGMESPSCRRSVLCEGDMLMAAFGTLLWRSRNERRTCASNEKPDWQQPVSMTELGRTMCPAYSRYTSCRKARSETFDGRDFLLNGAQSSDARPQNVVDPRSRDIDVVPGSAIGKSVFPIAGVHRFTSSR